MNDFKFTVTFCTEGQQQLPPQRVATNVLADDKKVQAKVAKKLAKQQVGMSTGLWIYYVYVYVLVCDVCVCMCRQIQEKILEARDAYRGYENIVNLTFYMKYS